MEEITRATFEANPDHSQTNPLTSSLLECVLVNGKDDDCKRIYVFAAPPFLEKHMPFLVDIFQFSL